MKLQLKFEKKNINSSHKPKKIYIYIYIHIQMTLLEVKMQQVIAADVPKA